MKLLVQRRSNHRRDVASPARLLWRRQQAFTLIEVMIATFIFFLATFAILGSVMQNLRTARLLKINGPTAGMVAAQLSLTNKLEEGSVEDTFGPTYPDYSWRYDVQTYGTNGLFQVEITIFHKDAPDSSVSVLMYRPESQPSTKGHKIFQ